jgi:hypothetical protein
MEHGAGRLVLQQVADTSDLAESLGAGLALVGGQVLQLVDEQVQAPDAGRVQGDE